MGRGPSKIFIHVNNILIEFQAEQNETFKLKVNDFHSDK